MNDLIEIDENKPVKQSNRLIEAKYKLTQYEQRMMLAICSQLDKNAENFDTVRVSVAGMAKFCNFDTTKGYSHVKNTIMRLLTRTLQIKSPNGGWYGTHWLQSAEYIPSESVIEYRVDDKLKPELLQLKQAYLSVSALPLMEFRRDYSTRFYLMLRKMVKIKDFEYELDFIRERFQLGKTYNIFINLKNRVIEPALEEINEKSDIRVEHEYIKTGRKYTKIKFTVALKKALPDPADGTPEARLERETGQLRLIESADEKAEDSEQIRELIGRMAQRGISEAETRRLLKKYGFTQVEQNRKWALTKKHGKLNLSGWIIDCIKADRASEDAETKLIAAEEERRQAEKQRAYWKSKNEPIVGADAKPEKTNPKQPSPEVRRKLAVLKDNLKKT